MLTGAEQHDSSSNRQFEHDFGRVQPDAELSHTFDIVNDSSITWTLKSVVRSCGCAVAHISAQQILPGHAERLTADLRLGKGPQDVRRQISLFFEEKEAPTLDVYLSTQVCNELTVAPPEINQRISYQERSTHLFALH